MIRTPFRMVDSSIWRNGIQAKDSETCEKFPGKCFRKYFKILMIVFDLKFSFIN